MKKLSFVLIGISVMACTLCGFAPATGDTRPIWLWVLIAAVSAILLLLLLILWIRSKKENTGRKSKRHAK